MRKRLGMRRIDQRDDTPLLDNNNVQDAYDQEVNRYDRPLDHHEEQRLQPDEELKLGELAELLKVQPGAISSTSADGFCCSVRPEPNPGQQSMKQSVGRLMQASVSQHFPKPPADLEQNLQQHMMNVQNSVLHELLRLGPLLDKPLVGLVDCYHRQTFEHLHVLLQDISSTQNYFVLINWVFKTYLSQELLGHPDLKDKDLITKVDLLLLTEWGLKAKAKLLKSVQKEVRDSLENILQIEKNQKCCNNEEVYVRLYVDTIQCVEAMSKEAQKISSELSRYVREVCFQELLVFVRRYKEEQMEVLRRKAKMDEPETIHFYKALKTCKELKQHVLIKGTGTSVSAEIVETLENMEAFTLKLLMDFVANITETHLKKYFRSHGRWFFLLSAVEKHFPKLCYGLDEQKSVMNEAYRVIVHIYVKHLIKTSQKKLKKSWKMNVGQTVTEDAELLHNFISGLAPGVQQWNLVLLNITQLLGCGCSEALKLTAASMQSKCVTMREDPELLPALLKWKGLSKRKVKEVLDALPASYQARSKSCFCCLM